MKSQAIEVLFILIALFAAVVSVAAVDLQEDGIASNAPAAYPASYPGIAYPPPLDVIVAPTQFPWWNMPTLPPPARWERVPPVFRLPSQLDQPGPVENPNAGANPNSRKP